MTAQQQAYKDFEAKLVAHLKAMDKAGKGTFNDWLAAIRLCYKCARRKR